MSPVRFLALLLLLVLCAPPASGEPASFGELRDELLDGVFHRFPSWPAALGLHAYDGRLPDNSANGLSATERWLDESIGRLTALEAADLTPLERVEHAALSAELRRARFGLRETRRPWRDPRAALRAIDLGPYVARDYAPLSTRAFAVLAIAKATPAYLLRAEAHLEPVLPAPALETAIQQTRGLADYVRGDVQEAMAGLHSESLRREVGGALNVMASAIDSYAAALEERREDADDSFRLGEERFLRLLEETEDIALSVDRLEELFEADLARNRAALVEVTERIDPGADPEDVVAAVLAKRPAQGHLLAVAASQAERLREALRAHEVATIPSDEPLQVEETPPFLRFSMAFLNAAGPFEERALPSFYYITPPDPSWSEEEQASYRPATADLLSITVHEAWPGHFLQGLHHRRIASAVLRAASSDGSGEGWAHYAEEVAWETGMIEGPEARLGQLLNALLRKRPRPGRTRAPRRPHGPRRSPGALRRARLSRPGGGAPGGRARDLRPHLLRLHPRQARDLRATRGRSRQGGGRGRDVPAPRLPRRIPLVRFRPASRHPARHARTGCGPPLPDPGEPMKIDGALFGEYSEADASAARMEADGYAAAFSFEGPHDPFFPLVLASRTTSRIELGTAIAVAFARNPMVCAHIAQDLQTLTQGRFILGLGTQIRPHIERRFSQPWSAPAARMREFVQAIRAIWHTWTTGERLAFEGEFYTHTLMTPAFNPGANAFGDPRIFVAGVGPKMVEVVGEVADGFFVHPFHSPAFLEAETLPALERGLARQGRAREDFEISCQTIVALGANEAQVQTARQKARGQLSFYGSTPAYRGVLDHHGYGDLQPELNRMSKQGEWLEMITRIDDALFDTLAVSGTPDEVGRKLRERNAGFADRTTLMLYDETGDPQAVREVIRGASA